MSKKSNKKKSCHLVPKVVIDLPFEGRKVKGSRKYSRRERVPKVSSRGEKTINEPINSRIGEFHTIVVGKCCLTCETWPSLTTPYAGRNCRIISPKLNSSLTTVSVALQLVLICFIQIVPGIYIN